MIQGGAGGDGSRLRGAHSKDGGRTIAARYDLLEASVGYLEPRLMLAGDGVDLLFYQGHSPPDNQGSLRRTHVSSQGVAASVVLYSPIHLQVDRNTQWLGDYSGVGFDGQDWFASYVDNLAQGVSHVAVYHGAFP